MPHISSDSLQSGLQLILLAVGQNILWVKNAWGLVRGERLLWILFEVLLGEDSLDILVEVEVSDLEGVGWVTEGVLEELELLVRQLYLLGVESGSELGGINNSLSKWIMILEELANSNSVSLDVVSNLTHKLVARF